MKKLISVLLLFISVTRINAQDITAAEYFFDSDPGAGNGFPISISSPGSTVNLSLNIPLNTLNPGFHWLAIRVKDTDGKWGLYERRSFYVSAASADMPVISAAEYFFDSDPGPGNGTVLPVSIPGNTITQSFTIPVPSGLNQGDHLLTIRVKDQAGNWSLFEKDTFTIANLATISCPTNVTINTTNGECSAMVNDIDPVVPPGSLFTYTLSGATTGSGNGTASGKIFNAGVTTVTYTSTSSPLTTCSFTVTVNSTVTPSVQIVASSDTTCPGSALTFTATPINGGNNPSYQWQKNGIDVGDDNSVFQSNIWANGDVMTVVMTSSLTCANSTSDTSDAITVTVISPYITPSVSISASATTICPGTTVTFLATAANGGVAGYAWSVNGVYIPEANNSFFESSTLSNGDKIRCTMTSSLACVTEVTAVSNEIPVTVLPVLAPQVNIVASSDTICAGNPVIFTATSVNGGSAPFYEWKVNDNVVEYGMNDSTFESSTLQNGDVVTVTLVSSLWCTNPQVVTSNSIAMTIVPSSPAFVNIAASATTICSGTSVTFIVTSVSTGAAYQWQLNGNNIPGAIGTTYQSSSLQNGDRIKVIMTPSSPCAIPSPAVSNEITVVVNSASTSTVTIDASAGVICSGQNVIFTATPVNAGSNVVYEWLLNENAVGTNSNVYQSSSLVDGDKIKVTMASWQACGGYSQAVSNTITMTVSEQVTPVLTMSASSSAICAGAVVTFYASPISGAGSSPSYQWKLNGNNIPGATNSTYQCSTLVNGDVIRAEMTSSLGCANPQIVLSHDSVTMTVSSVALAPSVSISGSSTTVCGGQTITFTATPTNGGAAPGYQWKLNGNNVGDNSAIYSSNSLQPADTITVEMTTSIPCSTSPVVTSGPIIMTAATEICDNGIDDNCNGSVDENCTGELPVLLVKTYPVKEGDAGVTILNIEVKLDQPASGPVSVNYTSGDATATAGSDYVATSGVVTIPAGSVSDTIQLRIIGDLLSEYNESFWVNFSNPVNVVLASDPRSRIMIIDDDKGKPNRVVSNHEVMTEQARLKIPTVARRNQVWLIPQIGNYENEVMVVNIQGQVISKFTNYNNQMPLPNMATGLYFYRIRITEGNGQYKYYSGRLFIRG